MTKIQIGELGEFSPNLMESGELICYSRTIEFRGSTAELSVYPEGNRPPSDESAARLATRLSQFTENVESQMHKFVTLLRAECREYIIDVSAMTDSQLIENLEWTNINLDPKGTIECYARNLSVTNNFDISLGFSDDFTLYRLQFDG